VTRDSLGAILAALRLMRPLNCLMSGFGTVLGMLATGGTILPSTLWRAAACGMLVTGGGNTLNDYHDADIDQVNHPARPIPSGQIHRQTVLGLAIGELSIALFLGWSVNTSFGLIALLAVAALIAYEWRLKVRGLAGNVVISLLVGLLFVAGGAAVGNLWQPASLGLLAFVATLGREIAKDIQDLEGDRPRWTWPMRVGSRRAGLLAAGLLFASVLLSPLPYLLGTLSVWYLYLVLLADLGFGWAIYLLFSRPARASRPLKWAMLAVLVAFLAGVLT
jgi:geranylgeranylglycerol-phosphate geranylgeranyltransferase